MRQERVPGPEGPGLHPGNGPGLHTPIGSLVTIAFLVLVLNSAYLAAFATPSLFYFANVALHVGLGVVLTVVCLWRSAVALADVRKSEARNREITKPRKRPWVPFRAFVFSWFRARFAGYVASAAPLAIAAATGIALTIVGATQSHQALLRVHIISSAIGSLVALAWLAEIARRTAAPRVRIPAVAAVAIVIVAGAWATLQARTYDTRRRAEYRVTNPDVPPLSMDDEGPGSSSPFFPSSANTTVNGTIPANFFLTSEMCGRCHRDIYEQWKSSVHHLSSFNNQWYRKSIEYMQDMVGTTPSKWCAGCHDHAVFFNGRFDRPIREQIETPEAQAGLACTSCHAITRVNSTMGQGDFVIEYPPLHDLATSDNPLLRFAHDRLTYLDPQPHRETFLKPFHREQTAQFCSTCHKVHLDVPVNGYRWFRGFNDYDNWQASGVSGEGARSFYYPPKSQKCADCHMPQVRSTDPAAKNGFVKSHRFPGANTALPFVNHDAEQLKTVQDFLRDGAVTVDVFGLVRNVPDRGVRLQPDRGDRAVRLQADRDRTARQPKLATTFAVGEESLNFGASDAAMGEAEEVVGPLDKVNAWVRRGESARIEAVVRTRKVGHFFPGGTVDAFDVWVELEAIDDRGRTILHSGYVTDEGKGPVEPGAHFYRSLLLDEHGNPINKRNAWAARSVAYVRLIPPGAADTVHYRLDVPPDAGDRIMIKARVRYRKFAWWNTQWAYAGVRDPADPHYQTGRGYDDGRWVFTGETSTVSGAVKAIPDIPITTIAEASASVRVIDRAATAPAVAPFMDKNVRERWNDYGIGLLLQGHLKGAEAVFIKVTEMDPGYADGFVNVGRARLQEGNLPAAEEILRRALLVDPNLAKTHFFLGTMLKNDGRYDEALAHLQTAADKYPRDRVVRNQLGHVLFLQRKFDRAIVELRRVLEIDPEDLQAHYNLMLAYQGVGRRTDAERERQLYFRFKADESAQAITGPYRQLHPDDNNERQPIHEHRSGQ